jgi:hypothetical protein
MPATIRARVACSAAQIAYGTDRNIYAYFATERGLQDKFHATLGAGAAAQAPGMLADYPWGELGDATVLDVGGEGGDFVVALLRGTILELESGDRHGAAPVPGCRWRVCRRGREDGCAARRRLLRRGAGVRGVHDNVLLAQLGWRGRAPDAVGGAVGRPGHVAGEDG